MRLQLDLCWPLSHPSGRACLTLSLRAELESPILDPTDLEVFHVLIEKWQEGNEISPSHGCLCLNFTGA